MARPRPTSKASKQRAGHVDGQGKRKHGGGTHGGGAGGRPAKLSRREGRSKLIDRDVYEAEDSDPDEVKHAERFDQVDNFEYELPSDFEDEEIDEDLAFTEEDNKKFGSWFEKEVSADEEGGVGVGDDDGEDWNDEDEGAYGTAEEEDDDDGDDGGGDEDDDLFIDDDDSSEGDDDDLGEGGGDEDEDERHMAMLEEILDGVDVGGAASRKRTRRDPNAAVVSEAYPESEYNLNPGAASAGGSAGGFSLADLLKGLTSEERRKLGAARKLLEKVAVGGQAPVDEDDEGREGGKKKRDKQLLPKGLRPVSVPLPSIIAERQERKAGYEAASEEVTKWQSIVKANREAPTLRLVAARNEVPRVGSTAAIVAQHTPSADNALEAEVAALLTAAGAHNTEAIQEAEEKLALKALTLEEARERRERLAKLRSLLFYHELKARRLKQIKSKEYHRHLARASKRKAAKLAAATAEAGGEPGDVAAERVAAIEAEFQRAKERLTLRHRNSSRWARRALKRGQLEMDPGTKAALAEQLQLGQQLKRKIEGRKGSGSDNGDDSDGSTSASDSEGGEGAAGAAAAARGAGRVRSAALELLADGGPLDLNSEDAPKKGLLALPFMKRAMERRRLAAQQQAQDLLRELEEQQHMQAQEDGDEDDRRQGGREDGGAGSGGAGGRDVLAALVGYGVSGTAGRRRFGAGADTAGAGGATAGADRDADGGVDDDATLDSDDVEDLEAKAERLGRRTAAAKLQQQAAERTAKKGGKGAQAPAAAPPTAAELADLDAAIRAGAAGKGLLVTSADAGVNLAVGASQQHSSRTDADAHRKEEAAAAARRATGRAAGTRGRGILVEVAAHQASLAAGGGRAALFSAACDAQVAAEAEAGGKAQSFLPSKKFTGPRPGYAFKRGAKGLGYYLDKKAAAAAGGGGGKGAGKEQKHGKQRKQEQQKKKKQPEGNAAPVDGAATAAAVTVAGQGKEQKGQKNEAGKKKLGAVKPAPAATVTADDGGGDSDEEAPLMRPSQQRDLIRQAFAGDDVEAEFAAAKAAAVAEELPNVEEPSTLPGWGAWAGQQRNPKWMQAAKEKAAKQREAAAAGRKDANLKYVVISEKWDKKASKYTAPTAPFPFTSKEDYERSLRQPLGREYNPDMAFRDLTRPAVLKQAGITIAPLRFSEPVAKELGKKGRKAEAKRDERRVATVAGGLPRLGKN